MRRGLLAEFAGRLTPLTDDEIATQNLADREDEWPVCIHGRRHVKCYPCLDVELLHIRAQRHKAVRLARRIAAELKGEPRAFYNRSRKTARRMLRHGRCRASIPICVHQRRQNECYICVTITAFYLRVRWRRELKLKAVSPQMKLQA